jgi:hypothetical protein
VSFEGDRVFVGTEAWRAPYPIADLRRLGDTIALIYDHFAGPNWRQFQNLEGFSLDGRKLWTAEHPTTEAADSYVAFLDSDGLVAWNFACYVCTLDPATGRLLSAEPTK